MTQEELDALMNGDMDSVEEEVAESDEIGEVDEDLADDEKFEEDEEEGSITESNYRVNSSAHWPPPPPDDDHKVVHQLDDVTKDSEEKATQILDIIESISNDLMEKEVDANACMEAFENNIKLFENLTEKFPHIQTFITAKQQNEEGLAKIKEVLGTLQDSGNSLMNVMDIMQYQDIHRQKIERVINVMRALSNYMNALFAGKIDDDKRVSSAVHIHGDDTTEDVVNADDIEALLAQFGTNG
ncbi:chemotaxis protein [bacterium]|nr:chemotaxis protein [bacterium]MBU1884105.1 chemotaxis protein [bacterium]